MSPYCPEALQTGHCTRSGCRDQHDVAECVPCKRFIPTQVMQAHVKGRAHSKVAQATHSPQVIPEAPAVSYLPPLETPMTLAEGDTATANETDTGTAIPPSDRLGTYCPDALQTGVCMRSDRCRHRHDIEHCVPCNRFIPAFQIHIHLGGKPHRKVLEKGDATTPTSHIGATSTADPQVTSHTLPDAPISSTQSSSTVVNGTDIGAPSDPLGTYCPQTLQTGVCIRPDRCRHQHDIEHCVPCNRFIPASQMPIHLRGKRHLEVARRIDTARNTPCPSTPSQPKGSPSQSDTTAVNIPSTAYAKDDSNTLPGPAAVQGASWCDICRIYVGTQGFEAHTQGKHHKTNVELMSTGASPGAIPIPEGFVRCDVCKKTFKQSEWNLHLKSQQHLNRQKYASAAAVDRIAGGAEEGSSKAAEGDEPADPGNHSNIDKNLGDASDNGDIIINPKDGHDFGVVERADDQSLFASSAARFTIHFDACALASLRPRPKVSLIEVKLLSSQSSQTNMFSSFLVEIEGDSKWIEPDASLRVMVTLIPSYEGRFEDTLLFVFHNFSSKADFTISRPVSGIAGSFIDQERLRVPEMPPRSRRPPRSNPSNFVPLRPPTWTRTQYKSLLPEFPLPSMFAETLHSPKFDKEIKHAAQAPMPVKLNVDTYGDYFETLLWLEEAYISRDLLNIVIGDVQVRPQYPRYQIDFAHEDELNLPDIKVGDYLILDQLSTDTRYEVRIHSGGYSFMEDGFVGPLVLRVPEGFSTYHGFKFDLRFVLNRMPLRRMHLAVSAPFKFGPARVLFPTLAQTPTISAYDVREIEYYNLGIGQDEEQTRTICSILYLPPGSVPFILYGPPGSGKTATISEAILQLLKRRSSCRILACCPSNSAADELTTRLSTHLSTGDMFRLNAFSRPLQDCRELVVPYTLSNDHDTFVFPPKSVMVKFRVVVSTCSSAGVLRSLGIPTGHYSHVFIDEAGQAEEPLTLIPITAVAGHDTNIILAGDPRQLGPVVKSHNVGLRRSFLERLMSQEMYNPAVGDGRTIVQLKKNRRSHEAIFTFSNQRFYDNQQQSAGNPKITHSLLGSSALVDKAFPVVFHGIQGRDRRGNSRSFYNIEEVSLVIDYCRSLVGDQERRVEAAEIGVISPYRMQVRAIRSGLREESLDDVTVGSVEQFQGQERRVIIFSTVRSNMETSESKSAGFIGDPRRLNVALTRAQALLIVIGDPAVLGKIPLWRGFLNFVHMRGGHRGKGFDWDPATDEPDATGLVDHVRTRIVR